MYQFHIKIILIVAITVILSGFALGQDAPIEENNNIKESEDSKINDIDNITESSGDEDLNEDQKKPISESIDLEDPESPNFDFSDNSQKIEIIVNSATLLTDLSPEIIGDDDWLNAENIFIDNNTIGKIEKQIFEKLPSLRKLSLKGNQLKKLETETFSEATKLTELNLDNNPLELPEEAQFLTTSSLRKFSMSDCNLKMIKDDTFIGMTGLEELDIGKNQINEATPITKKLFEPLSNLTKLIIPIESSEVLIKEVCKTHPLLPKICLDECDTINDYSCENQETNDTEPKMSLNSDPEESPPETQLPVSELKENPAEITEKPAEITEKPAEITEKPAEITEKPTEIPEKAAEITDKLAEITEKAAEMTEKTFDNPIMRKMPGDSDIQSKNQDETLDMTTNGNGNIGIIRSINTKTVGENVGQSTSDVSSQSPNGAAIGVIIGVIIIIITGIIVKKNWGKIKSKWSSDERSNPAQISGQNVDRIRKPEEVPLKANTEADNPV